MTQHGLHDITGNITSYENMSAPVALVQALEHQVDDQDVQALIQAQKHMLIRFEKTNEMLITCNALLSARYGETSKELKKHIQLLVEMKKDLESVFRRIRFLKMKLSQQYPAAISASQQLYNVFDEEEEQDEQEKESSSSGQKVPRLKTTTTTSSSGSQDSSSPVTSPSTSDSG